MKTFREWIESRLFRMDREKCDFSDQESLGNYYFVQSGSGRIDDPENLPSWAKGGQMKRGLFAGSYDQILSYLIPRNAPYVLADGVSKNTLYINKRDIGVIKAFAKHLSSADLNDQGFIYRMSARAGATAGVA